ncbi:hypothetical protein ZWY2020_035652 [Hordeum vulgare]|nr:hypothetical protein ZWY2020_035652 [Hordeum vulgare]
MDNIPDIQANPPKTDDVTMDPSQKENLNPPSPLKSSKDTMFEEDAVLITRMGHTMPVRNVLAKHTAGDISMKIAKGNAALELPNIEKLNFKELHAGYLNRLSTSRDLEASLVNMMKKRYETISQADASLSGMKRSLGHQQDARAAAEEQLRATLAELEKDRAEHLLYKELTEAEKAALVKHAENAKD